MKIKPALLGLVAFIFSLPGTLVFGQTIKFDSTFKCNNERVSVSSCFDDSDEALCSVYYPDRPLHNGIMVPETQKRGDVIKMIKACMGPGATLASTGNPAPASAPSRPATTSAAPAAKPATPPPPPDPSVAKARAAGIDLTVLGVPLGQAVALSPCQELDPFSAIFSGQSYANGQKFPCIQQNAQSASGVENEIINFSQDQCPSWVSGCSVTATVRNGLLLAIYMKTTGYLNDPAPQALRDKYGKPTKDTPQKLNTANAGVMMTLDTLEWDLPGLRVEYNPIITYTSAQLVGANTNPIVRFETDSGYQMRTSTSAGPKL
jgi:hypothetical protein